MTNDERQRLKKLLHDSGLKISLARLKILEVLDGSERALSARELCEELSRSGEDISVLTVRQVLGRLGSCAVVARDGDGRYRLCPTALAC